MRQRRPEKRIAGTKLIGRAAIAAALVLSLTACNPQNVNWLPVGTTQAGSPPATPQDADTGFTETSDRSALPTLAPPVVRVITIQILHIQWPHTERERAMAIWNHLREDGLASADTLRLRRNGIRIGIGHERWWEAIKAILDNVDGIKVSQPAPINIRPDFPLALELDLDPREQTLFFVDSAGELHGATWPHSRNVLRIQYLADEQRSGRTRLAFLPAVLQRQASTAWSRSELGGWQVTPNQSVSVFPAARFVVDLAPGEFVAVAPSERGSVAGLIGTALLTRQDAGTAYESVIFVRPDVSDVGQHD